MPIELAQRAPERTELAEPLTETRLNILLVAHKFPPFIGGIETHTFEVGRRMAAAGHAVTVLTADPSSALATEEKVAGMQIVRVGAYPRSSDIFLAPGIYREIIRGTWDVAHIQGFHTFVPPIAMLAATRKSLPFVMTFHSGGHSSSWRNVIRGVQQAILRPLIVRADAIIGVSEFEADHFSKGLDIPRDRIIVVPNGAEIATVHEVEKPRRTAPIIVSVGRLERYKGHHRVIAAFADVRKRLPKAQLRVLGEGPYKAELIELVQRLGLQGCVTIGGIPPGERQRMAAILAGASVVVLLSEYEAHPVAALEAISLGCRVIANNSTGFAEMAAKGLLRGIDPAAAPQLVADAIIEEVNDPAIRVPPTRINNWDDCTNDLLRVYRTVLARRSDTNKSTVLSKFKSGREGERVGV
jgi:glycosyltransferase involved in cell wall biosynthesis